MNRLTKLIALSAVSMATIFAPLSSAFAYDGWGGGPRDGWDGGPRGGWGGGPRYYDRHHDHYRHRGHGDAVAAGVVGLAAGAILGSALSQPSQPQVIYQAPPPPPPVYYQQAPVYYQPAPAYRPVYQPWTLAWSQYCSGKYRSFNPQTGTYRGLDGQNHFCNGN